MGQEVSVTPLQLARIGAAIANGGRLVTPRLVRRIVHPDGRTESLTSPPAPAVLTDATARTLRDLMVGVVVHGTGKKAAIPGFAVAGKTGTAQKAGVGGYQPGRYVASFVGFAPSENPRIVGLVLIEEPKGRYYGGEVAAPIFSRVVSQALGILRVAPEEQRLPETILASNPSEKIRYPDGVVPASARSAGEPPQLFSPPAEPAGAFPPETSTGLTPWTLGLSARQALALFARRGLSARIEGSGFVVEQDPPPGAPLRPGTTCTLRLAEPAAATAVPGGGVRERRAEELTPPLPGP
jgi:membrane peptidoglycan carboxypeptidase